MPIVLSAVPHKITSIEPSKIVLFYKFATLEIEPLAECALPESNRLGVGNRRKLIKQHNF